MRLRHVLPAVALATLASAVGAVPAADPVPPPPPMPAPAPLPVTPPGVEAVGGSTTAKWMIELRAKNVPTGYAVLWAVTPKSKDAATTRVVKADRAFLLAGRPGTYEVTTYFVKGEDSEQVETTVTLTGDPRPEPQPNPPVPPGPGPQPNPNPPEPPKPVGKVARVVFVEDTGKAGAWRGDLLGSPQVQALFRNGPIAQRIVTQKTVAADGAPDPEAAKYQQLAAGKDLPWMWTLDAAGQVVLDQKVPLDPDLFVKAFPRPAHERAMGNNPPNDPPGKEWKVFGAAPNVPIIDRSQWKPVTLANFLPPVHDQDGRGQCNASATCTAIETARFIAGCKYVYLSAGDLYSRINGGRDQGSLLEDGLRAATEEGVATAASVPYVWDGRRYESAAVKAERAKYRVTEAYVCPNFDAMASAVQQGFVIVHGLMWFDNFRVDRDGWLPGRGAGGGGGHALCGYGLAQKADGTWGIPTRNSWAEEWGVNGNCVIPESLFGRQIGGLWAVRAVVQNKDDFGARRLNPFAEKGEFALAP